MLTGKNIVLGVTGSIAAYKIANLASMLVKLNANVHVIMTHNATQFITPLTFETLTGNKCIVDTFDRNFNYEVKHVSLAKSADVFLVAPCSANVIGKLAGGICDDMLTTTLLATKAPKIIAPAMNTGMWENPILQDNLQKLQRFGYHFVAPACGRLACGDVGNGKMPEPEDLLDHILLHVARQKNLAGRRILISAGPTQEAIDPVRYITNRSSGKMGYALAKMAAMRGAEVTLVSGPVNLRPFVGVDVVPVRSAQQMFDAIKSRSASADVIIMCSAVADYTPAVYSDQKVKKSDGD
jgi:phosphopantothenoylcysteine decarboxylase/phosphopantothenate--cysteine ligase